MRILKIWIFSQGGQQLFIKEYDTAGSDSIVPNMLNAGVIHSFLNFFNTQIVRKYCDLMLFDDILFTFHYVFDDSIKFITLMITQIDKKIDLEIQANVLHKVARSISYDFSEAFKGVMEDVKINLNIFKPFESRCDEILHGMADELESELQDLKVKINGFWWY